MEIYDFNTSHFNRQAGSLHACWIWWLALLCLADSRLNERMNGAVWDLLLHVWFHRNCHFWRGGGAKARQRIGFDSAASLILASRGNAAKNVSNTCHALLLAGS